MNTIFILTIVSLSLITLILSYKYFNLNKKAKSIIKDLEKPLRKGYYEEDFRQTKIYTGLKVDYTGIIHVSELERYKNGKSKIQLDHIDIRAEGTISMDDSKTFIKDNFVSIVNTSDITWLELEDDIKEIRRHKLEQLKEILKNE